MSWLKYEATPAGSECIYETLAGVDPEYFYLFVQNTGLYKNQIYKVTINALGEGELVNLKPEDLSDSLEAGGSWGLTNTFISTDGQLYTQQATGIGKEHAQQGEWLRYNLGKGGWLSVKQPRAGLNPYLNNLFTLTASG